MAGWATSVPRSCSALDLPAITRLEVAGVVLQRAAFATSANGVFTDERQHLEIVADRQIIVVNAELNPPGA